MTEIHVAKELAGVAPTDDGQHCRLDFQTERGGPAALVFPIDQLNALLGLLLQVEQRQVKKSGAGKMVLQADSVDVGLDRETQNVLLGFRVGKMEFPFTLPREHAVNLAHLIQNKLPTH